MAHALVDVRGSDGVDEPGRVRAIWSPDYRPFNELDELIALIGEQPEPEEGPTANPDLLRLSLDPLDRAMLVTLMAGFDAQKASGAADAPRPAVERSETPAPLGARRAARCRGHIGEVLPRRRRPRSNGVISPRLGRDHYVRVMYAGYLCPFGHAASLIKVTERKFQSIAQEQPQRIAVLRQRFFIVVREPVRTYAAPVTTSRPQLPFTAGRDPDPRDART